MDSSVAFAYKHLTGEGFATFTTLAVLSLVSSSIVVGKIFSLRRQRRRADAFYASYEKVKDPFELIGKDEEFEGAPPYSVYDYACRELQKILDRYAPREKTNGRGRRAPARVLPTIRAAMERGINEETSRLESGMVMLAIAISGGPFIGLFGTVLGVMDTFARVAQAGQPNLLAIAPGVAGALLNTVLGLLVAIPALFAFNLLQRSINDMQMDMTSFASELEGLFVMEHVDEGPKNDYLAEPTRSSSREQISAAH
jgi:biopolymer transport protein ExbB/TolQ